MPDRIERGRTRTPPPAAPASRGGQPVFVTIDVAPGELHARVARLTREIELNTVVAEQESARDRLRVRSARDELEHQPVGVEHSQHLFVEASRGRLMVDPEPRQPIVFWLENTIPTEYREAVREGILVWNSAFERIGFDNAIVVKQQPDDAEWDASDVRYSTVRWIVRPGGGYAVGPSRTNPFTGQIYDADIRVSADMIRSIFGQFEEFAKPVAMGDKYAAEMGLTRTAAEGMCDHHTGAMEQAAFGWSVVSSRGTMAPPSRALS